jgi:hypothetical protein
VEGGAHPLIHSQVKMQFLGSIIMPPSFSFYFIMNETISWQYNNAAFVFVLFYFIMNETI